MEQRDEKKQVLTEALEAAPTVFLHLDARRAGVKVPDAHRENPQLILRVGYMLSPPINIVLGEEAVTCTLSFNKVPFSCALPWDSIYAIVGDDGRAAVWPDDIPPEAARMKEMVQPAARPVAAVPNPGKGPSAPSVIGSARKSVDTKAKRPNERRKEKPKPGPLAPSIRERPVNVRTPSSASAASKDEGASGDSPRDTPAPAAERKPKRELPPYLRVIK
jgi:stringent starvation protein B